MGPMFLGAARRVAIAWSDVLLDLDQRWLQARKRVFAPDVKYGTDDLVQDSMAMWLVGMRAWERMWNAAYGPAQPPVPVILIRNPSLVGEATVTGLDFDGPVQTTDLAHQGGGRAIPRNEVHATVDANGVLSVKVRPRNQGERDAGLYRGVVFSETAGTPRVIADVVLELTYT